MFGHVSEYGGPGQSGWLRGDMTLSQLDRWKVCSSSELHVKAADLAVADTTTRQSLVESAIIFPMCGRYRLSRGKQFLEEHFGAEFGDQDWAPRYNIAPTQSVPVIRQNSKESSCELSLMRWGLIPSWSTGPSTKMELINARAETASEKPAFRDALRSRRCLIPADGFYEWQRTGKLKQPYCFEVKEGELFAFAGIWDSWNHPSGRTLETCSILTATPNAVTAKVHDVCRSFSTGLTITCGSTQQ